MEKIIKNQSRIDNFINKLSKSKSEKIQDWIQNDLKEYLINEYSNFKIVDKTEDAEIVHIVLGKQIKEEINQIIDWIPSLNFKSVHFQNYSFDELLNFSNIDNFIFPLGKDYYLAEIKSNELKEELINKHNISHYNSQYSLWVIVNNSNEICVVIPNYLKRSFKGHHYFSADTFYFNHFPTEALREFYYFTQKHLVSPELDPILCNHYYINKVTGKELPLSIWEDNGILNTTIDLALVHNVILPKNLTIKGNLYIQRSGISYLGNGLTVKGNVYAQYSQLAVVDHSVIIEGSLYSEGSLLMSYSNDIRKKIINPKKLQQIITDF